MNGRMAILLRRALKRVLRPFRFLHKRKLRRFDRARRRVAEGLEASRAVGGMFGW